ncbi:serine hydrolase domain-containing protein [Nocardia vulneris]|uniref:serine hydrolase domain-containing protein n=1 Tax=Nocardia vulneris TaxID=1141657 RepID=UPI0030D09E04
MISREALQDKVERLAAELGVTGAAVGVSTGGGTEYATTGIANLTTGLPVGVETLFAAGSVTKVYSTSLLLTFVDDGQLDLDAPVRHYLPQFRLREEDFSAQVTVRMLLQHTSGLPGSFMPDVAKSPGMLAEQLKILESCSFNYPPGQFWSYSNAGMLTGGRIVEVLSGQTWDDALRDRILKPLGLRATTRTEEMILEPTAIGHVVDSETGATRPTPRFQLDSGNGPAGTTLWCDIRAMIGFARMHLTGGRAPGGGAVLSEAAVAAMQTPQVEIPAGMGVDHWGLGWYLVGSGKELVLGHTGGNAGQHAMLSVLPNQDGAIAVLTNSTTGVYFCARLTAMLLEECFGVISPAPAVPESSASATDLGRFVGTYVADEGHVVVTEKDNVLRLVHEVDPVFGDMMSLLFPVFPPPPMTLTPLGNGSFAGDGGMPVSFVCPSDTAPADYAFVGRVFRRKN